MIGLPANWIVSVNLSGQVGVQNDATEIGWNYLVDGSFVGGGSSTQPLEYVGPITDSNTIGINSTTIIYGSSPGNHSICLSIVADNTDSSTLTADFCPPGQYPTSEAPNTAFKLGGVCKLDAILIGTQ
jgi:hypothetical protein